MKLKVVAVELQADHIDVVAYVNGKARDGRRLSIELNPDPGEWTTDVRRAGSRLRSAVEELQVKGQPTYVLYRSPTQAVELSSVRINSAAQAIEGARLGCINALPYASSLAVCQGTVAVRDARGEHQQTHVVVTAEREDASRAIAQMIEDAELEFVAATPMDAAALAMVVSDALHGSAGGNACLYVGERSSVFAVVGDGRLLFARRIGLGLDSLAHSLTRPIRRSAGAESMEVDLPDARRLLHSHGIPDRDAVLDEECGLRGAHIIPLLQPVLQRFIVELRQSIRFGLPEDQREQLSLRITGPGSHLPGLVKLVGKELNAEARVDADYPVYDWDQPGSPGSELSDAISRRNVLSELNLQPKKLAERRQVNRVRRWMWTGATAAMTVIGLDAVQYGLQLDEAREQMKATVGSAEDIEQLRETGERLIAAHSAMNKLELRIEEVLGTGMDYRTCLLELSRITPQSVRFTSLRLFQDGSGTRGELDGYAFTDMVKGEQSDLESFVDSVKSSPLFINVELGSVQRSVMGGRQGERFGLSFTGIAAPFAASNEAVVQAGETAP